MAVAWAPDGTHLLGGANEWLGNPGITAVQDRRKACWCGEDCSREEGDSESVLEVGGVCS